MRAVRSAPHAKPTVPTKTGNLNSRLVSVSTRRVAQTSVLDPVTVKFALRPDIRGSTRVRRMSTIGNPLRNLELENMDFSAIREITNNFRITVVPKTVKPVKSAPKPSVVPKRAYSTDNKKSQTLTKTDEKTILENITRIEKEKYDAHLEKNSETELERINKDVGLANYLKTVFTVTGIGCAGFLATSAAFASIMNPALSSIVIGSIGSFASIYFFGKSQPKYETRTIEKDNRKYTIKVAVYDQQAYIAATSLCASMGLAISPAVAAAGVAIAVKAAFVSAAVTGGAATAALFSKPGSLLPYQTVAYGALFGLIGVGLMSIGAGLLGYGTAFEILRSIDVYGGIALFSVLTAMDTQQAIQSYKDGKPNHLDDAVKAGLNFANIFVRVLEAMAKAKKD